MVWMAFKGGKQVSLLEVLSFFKYDPQLFPRFSTQWDPSNFAWIALQFSTHQDTLYRLSFLSLYFILFSLMLSTLFSFPFSFPFFSLLSSSFFRYGYKRGFSCFILLLSPSVPTYLPRHLRDHRFRDVLGFEAYVELMSHLKETDIQQIMEWCHISSVVQSCCRIIM